MPIAEKIFTKIPFSNGEVRNTFNVLNENVPGLL